MNKFLRVIRTLARILPRVLLIYLMGVGLIAITMIIALILGAPTIQQVTGVVTQDTNSAYVILIFSSIWALLPFGVMIIVAVCYAGMVLHYTDGQISQQKVRTWPALWSLFKRSPSAIAASIVYILAILLAIALAPLLTICTLILLIGGKVFRSRFERWKIPSVPVLGILAVPFAVAAMIAVRWSLIFPEIFMGNASWFTAFRASWNRTNQQIGKAAVALTLATIGTLLLVWASLSIGFILQDPSLELALQVISSMILAAIPLIVVQLLYRERGGSASSALGEQANPHAHLAIFRMFHPAVRTGVGVIVAILLLSPPQLAIAAPAAQNIEQSRTPASSHESLVSKFLKMTAAPEETVTTLTLVHPDRSWSTYGKSWEFGDAVLISGTVASASNTTTPGGTVQLWAQYASEPAPVQVGSDVVLDNGTFSFDPNTLLPQGFQGTKLWVEYLGDSAHAPSQSTETPVDVYRKSVMPNVDEILYTAEPQVGDLMTLRVSVGGSGSGPGSIIPIGPIHEIPGFPLDGNVRILNSENGQLMGQAMLVDGVANIDFVMPFRRMQYIVDLDESTNPWYTFDCGCEYVLQSSFRPAETTTDISTLSSAIAGDRLKVTAQINPPAGVPVDGNVTFWIRESQQDTPVKLTTTRTTRLNNLFHADVQLCVGMNASETAEAINCTITPNFMVDQDSTAFEIKADFAPNVLDVEEWYEKQTLYPSSSDWVSLQIQDGRPPAVTCRVVKIHKVAEGYPHASQSFLSAMGAPSMNNSPNCQTLENPGSFTGFKDGSTITLHAKPKAGFELVEWKHAGQSVGTNETLVWRVGDFLDHDFEFTDLEVVYRPICLPIQHNIIGWGDVNYRAIAHPYQAELTRGITCVLTDGTRGAYLGSIIEIEAFGSHNPQTDEADVVYRARLNNIVTQTTRVNSFGVGSRNQYGQSFQYTLNRGVVASVEFGPTCRAVNTEVPYPQVQVSAEFLANPHAPQSVETRLPELLSEPNCFSPFGSGYLRGSTVAVQVEQDDPELVVAGWRINGELVPELGNGEVQVEVVVGADETTTIEYDFARCLSIEGQIAEGQGAYGYSSGSTIDYSPAPNCFDGSERWVQGTEVTLRAVPGVNALSLAGWTDLVKDEAGETIGDKIIMVNRANEWMYRSAEHIPVGQMDNFGVRTIVLEESLSTTAQFYFPQWCSTVHVANGYAFSEFRLDDTGCGPGMYFDRAKGVLSQSQSNRYSHDDYLYDINRFPYSLIGVYAASSTLSLSGTVEMSQAPTNQSWTATEKFDFQCAEWGCSIQVRGDATIRPQLCQPLNATVYITVAGDVTEHLYTAEELGLEEFEWIVSSNPGCNPDGPLEWAPGNRTVLRTQAPGVGFEFLDWGNIDNLTALEMFAPTSSRDPLAPLAVHVQADDTKPNLDVELYYRVHCANVNLGDSLAIVEPAPNCPGATDAENSYIIGTLLQVAAQEQNRSGRYFEGFRGDISGTGSTIEAYSRDFMRIQVNSGTNWQPNTKVQYHTALALVDADPKLVWGYYQHPKSGWEKFVGGIPQAGKLMVGLVTLGITAAIPLCAPCAGAIAALQVSEFLLRLIPGGDPFANILAMYNPMNFMQCVTRWGFNNLDNSSTEVTDQEAGVSGAGMLYGLATRGAKSVIVDNEAALKRLNKVTKAAKMGGATATFAYGLYENRIDQLDFAGASSADLRDTEGFENCLGQTYKNPNN